MEENWIVVAAVVGYVLYQLANFNSKRAKKSVFPVPPPQPKFDVPDFRPKLGTKLSDEPKTIQQEEPPKRKKKVKPVVSKPASVTMGELLDEFTRYQPKKPLGADDDSTIKYQGRHSVLTQRDYERLEPDKRYSFSASQANKYADMLNDLEALRDAFILNELINRKNWDEEI